MKNQVQLITYVDRLGGGTLASLHQLMRERLKGLFGGVHLLPFFYPIDGIDAGFDPIDHTQVDPRLGEWSDIATLTKDVDVMADVIVNHMSSESPQFKDFSEKGSASAYNGLFLTVESVFPNGASQQDWNAVYRPRPGLPLTTKLMQNGETRVLWATFTPEQIDIDVEHPEGKKYLQSILQTLSQNGVRMVRLDAVGYAIKKAGASCFMMPETFDFIDRFAAIAKSLGIEVLVEIHSYYKTQIKIASRVDWVYDFALPPLVLHAFEFKTAQPLKDWIAIRPANSLTVLDTHDGIGIIDIGADSHDRANQLGLVSAEELSELVERIHHNSKGQSRLATGAAASNLDLYQVNCTYFDAMARDPKRYWLARAIQFFLPGIPQVYYVGLLAGLNDMELLERTKVGRDINRHYYDTQEIDKALLQPVVQELFALIRLRNQHDAFNGDFVCHPTANKSHLQLSWKKDAAWANLVVDFESGKGELTHSPL
jgi:sucrose phosphorylase